MPGCKVKRAKDKRDIQVHAGALYLADYKWSLKNWAGELIATQHFKISSEGDAAKKQSICMGRYTLVKNIVMQDDSPVYKHDRQDMYLYRSKSGWCVSGTAGYRKSHLSQLSNCSLSPSKTLPWQYADTTNHWQEDITLRAYPCY